MTVFSGYRRPDIMPDPRRSMTHFRCTSMQLPLDDRTGAAPVGDAG
jgi:hypothetical protein